MKEFCDLEIGEEITLLCKACPGTTIFGKVFDVGIDNNWLSFEKDGYECFIDAIDVFIIGKKIKDLEKE
jgi:hypothetical protein